MKPIIVIPTYNEKENIKQLIPAIRKEVKQAVDILVVDSGSPDGTGEAVEEIRKTDPAVHLIQQGAKLGLGRAYFDGMRWAAKQDYDCLITMDADFSHKPAYLNNMFEALENHDLVIGSRYVKGGQLKDWPKTRQWLSAFANWYARTLTGLPFRDLTSGFQCFRMALLKRILRYTIHADGYALLTELKFLAILQGARFLEIPIIFTDRTHGTSKVSKRVILEAVILVLQRSFHRWRIKKNLARIKSESSAREKASLSA